MDINLFLEKVRQITERNPELNYKVRFDTPEGKIFVDGTTRPNRVLQEDLPADTAIEISLEDAFKFLDGELNTSMAFFTGRLKVQGSLGVALKLAEMAKGSQG